MVGALLVAGTIYVAGGSAREGAVVEPPPEALPSGFRDVLVTGGLNLPVAFALLPDGSVLVAELGGVVRLVEDGGVRPEPVLDISDRVNDFYERGLMSIAVDPEFEQNGFIYLLYTYENDPSDYEGPKTGRLGRFTVTNGRADPDSEVVVLGTRAGRTCGDFAPGADCIPQDWNTHAVGTVEFAPDGTLFVSTGDAAPWEFVDERAFRSQRLDTLAGKILRVARTGNGLATNPFWDGNPASPASKIWALGLRNPFRFELRPGTDTPYVGDVGDGLAEEISIARRGANLGWPCWEGGFHTPGYEPLAACQEMYTRPSASKEPLVFWRRDPRSAAAVGGAFYTGTAYPSRYRGAYFYGDYGAGFMKYVRVTADDRLAEGPFDFAPVSGLVDVEMGADGHLYYLSLTGGLRRFEYDG
jgi:glucose/arabinose dehydrogenase